MAKEPKHYRGGSIESSLEELWIELDNLNFEGKSETCSMIESLRDVRVDVALLEADYKRAVQLLRAHLIPTTQPAGGQRLKEQVTEFLVARGEWK